jgi:hypothetical protein
MSHLLGSSSILFNRISDLFPNKKLNKINILQDIKYLCKIQILFHIKNKN